MATTCAIFTWSTHYITATHDQINIPQDPPPTSKCNVWKPLMYRSLCSAQTNTPVGKENEHLQKDLHDFSNLSIFVTQIIHPIERWDNRPHKISP
ncbi:MAG TPA: hypothetical protein DCE42_29735 [Myxococcales bacterium]|nr:hypothetical protein [Deltaproteobacteria bacterium]HAA58973.1 hypothetical protein [Myxococcales bacterium]